MKKPNMSGPTLKFTIDLVRAKLLEMEVSETRGTADWNWSISIIKHCLEYIDETEPNLAKITAERDEAWEWIRMARAIIFSPTMTRLSGSDRPSDYMSLYQLEAKEEQLLELKNHLAGEAAMEVKK